MPRGIPGSRMSGKPMHIVLDVSTRAWLDEFAGEFGLTPTAAVRKILADEKQRRDYREYQRGYRKVVAKLGYPRHG